MLMLSSVYDGPILYGARAQDFLKLGLLVWLYFLIEVSKLKTDSIVSFILDLSELRIGFVRGIDLPGNH